MSQSMARTTIIKANSDSNEYMIFLKGVFVNDAVYYTEQTTKDHICSNCQVT